MHATPPTLRSALRYLQHNRGVELVPVDAHNWRACSDLEVRDDQARFVAPVARYLALCAYDDGPWRPLAITVDGRVVGFVMHGVDAADNSYWIGGLVIDRSQQGRGHARSAVRALVERARAAGHLSVALSYQDDNAAARTLYRSLGFVETGEVEDGEVVARLALG